MDSQNIMNLTEALAKTATVDLGVEARCVRRRDRRGRIWYLIGARDKLFLVRQDMTGFMPVSLKLAAQWTDWRPQSPEEAAREVAILNTPSGRHFRNTVLGLFMGPVPAGLRAPDFLPSDL